MHRDTGIIQISIMGYIQEFSSNRRANYHAAGAVRSWNTSLPLISDDSTVHSNSLAVAQKPLTIHRQKKEKSLL